MVSINTHGGGSNTTKNGLAFEQNTSLSKAFSDAGYSIVEHKCKKSKYLSYSIYCNGVYCGYVTKGTRLYKDVLEPKNVHWEKLISQQLFPDDVFISDENKVAHIVEKKFQNTHGSVDEKLQTCDYKRRQYEKLFGGIGFEVKYIYVLNDWFKQDRYKDVLDYIVDSKCYYFFNSIPLSFFNLSK